MTINKFQGETDWDALVNDAGLDLEEEDEFREYLKLHGFTIGNEYHIKPDISLEQLENALAIWQVEQQGTPNGKGGGE